MISEAAPGISEDYYYTGGDPFFHKTTVQAFNDAGVKVASIRELVKHGIYFTQQLNVEKRALPSRQTKSIPAQVSPCKQLLEPAEHAR
jgi:hypothetical protein